MYDRMESSSVFIPKEYLLRILAQCMIDTGISTQDVENAIEKETILSSKNSSNKGKESQVDALIEDIRNGRWDTVLESALGEIEDYALACDLLELVVKHLVKDGEHEAAKIIMTRVPLMAVLLPKKDAIRYDVLMKIVEKLQNPFTEHEEEGKERFALASRVEAHLKQKQTRENRDSEQNQTPLVPGRLIQFIQDGLKWRRLSGSKALEWHTEEGEKNDSSVWKKSKLSQNEEPTRISLSKPRSVASKFGKNITLLTSCVSPDGETFAVGTSDGFIELMHTDTMKKRKDLAYQNNDEPLLLDSPVTCMAFSLDGMHLACGDGVGAVHLFNVETGAKIKCIQTGHANGVSCIAISPDENRLASGGVDRAIRVFSQRSGSRLCECIGHESFINTISYVSLGRLLSASSDEKCCLWNATTGEQLRVFSGFHGRVIRAIPFHPNSDATGPACYNQPGEMTHALVCSASRLSVIALDGSATSSTILSRFSPDIVDGVLSRSGKHAFCWVSDGKLIQVELENKAQITSDQIGMGGKAAAQTPITLCASSISEMHIVAMWSNGAALFTS